MLQCAGCLKRPISEVSKIGENFDTLFTKEFQKLSMIFIFWILTLLAIGQFFTILIICKLKHVLITLDSTRSQFIGKWSFGITKDHWQSLKITKNHWKSLKITKQSFVIIRNHNETKHIYNEITGKWQHISVLVISE